MTITPATQPANLNGIMNTMLNQVVRPDLGGEPQNGSATNQPAPQAPAPQAEPSIPSPATPPVTPAAVTPAAPQPAAVTPPVQAKQSHPASPSEVETNFFTDDPEQAPAEAEAQAAPDEEPDMSDVPETPASENWKKVREALKNDRKALKKAQRELAEAQRERDAWAKGEKIPEVLTAKDSEIQRLQEYERLMNGRLSDEYQELVVKPTQETKSSFTKLAEDYHIPENIREALVAKIVGTESEKERNALITRYFPDALGAGKAKELVLKMHELGQIAIDMEKKPQETHQTLQAKYEEKLKLEDSKRAEVFENVAKSAWSSALEKTSKEGIYSDLILDPSNSEHNKVVERNQHKAAIQFGALVKQLKAAGLKTLPDNIAQGLARSILLSIGGVGAYKQAHKLAQELKEIKESSSVQTAYFRPGANSNGGISTPKVESRGPMNPQEAGKMGSAFFNGKA